MKTKNIIVLPYNSVWKTEFNKIEAYLEGILEDTIEDIEHVGSTSVEGLAAKPIIDIDVVIESYNSFEEIKGRLEKAGYYYEGDLGIKDRQAFAYDEREKSQFMTHHLYVCPKYSEELHRHIVFRDYMRTNQGDVKKYSDIKMKAAKLYPKDIDSYLEYKSPCILEIYKKLGLEK